MSVRGPWGHSVRRSSPRAVTVFAGTGRTVSQSGRSGPQHAGIVRVDSRSPATSRLGPAMTSSPRPHSAAPSYADVERALLARWPETRMDPTLARIRALVDLLGDPQTSYPVIH